MGNLELHTQIWISGYQYYMDSVFWRVSSVVTLLFLRFLTSSMQFLSMRARHQPGITGPTSTTMPTSAGWSTTTSASLNHRGRSWSGTPSGAWPTPVPTVWCISMTGFPTLLQVHIHTCLIYQPGKRDILLEEYRFDRISNLKTVFYEPLTCQFVY